MGSSAALPNIDASLSLAGGHPYFCPTRPFSDTTVSLKIDTERALAGLSSFNSKYVVREFENRYPRAFEILRKCGVLATGACDVMDPYTGIIRREPFNNIFEHSMAVGFAAQAIGRELLRVKAITLAELELAVEGALLHDATKPYEIFRRRIGFYLNDALKIFDAAKVRAQTPQEVFAQIFEMLLAKYKDPQAFAAYVKYTGWFFTQNEFIDAKETQAMLNAARCVAMQHNLDLRIIESLEITKHEVTKITTDTRAQKLLSSVIDYGLTQAFDLLPELLLEYMPKEEVFELERSGAETGWLSYGNFLAVSSTRDIVGIRGNWVDAIIHVADDMTGTNVPKEIDRSETYFLTTNERLIISGLIVRVGKVMMSQWIGASSDGSIVELKNGEPIPLEVTPIANVATLMIYITGSICERIKEVVALSSTDGPDDFVKRLVNDSYERLKCGQEHAARVAIAA